jgi:hypothetical protein
MITKFGKNQKVEAKNPRGEWIPGTIFQGLGARIYQVQTAQGFLTVREDDIRAPQGESDG